MPNLSQGGALPICYPKGATQSPNATKNTAKITRFGLALFSSFTFKCLESIKVTQIRIVWGSMSIKKLWGYHICMKIFCRFMIFHLKMFKRHYCQKNLQKTTTVSAKKGNLQIAHWFRYVRCLRLVDLVSYDSKALFYNVQLTLAAKSVYLAYEIYAYKKKCVYVFCTVIL